MSSHTHHFHHHFFVHKEVNGLYISILLMNLAESLISLFIPIYLYSLGYSAYLILLFYLLAHVGSVVCALPAAQVVARVGAKWAMVISTPFLLVYYGGLRLIPEAPWLLFVLPFFSAARSVLYNFSFGLNFFQHTDRKDIGRGLSLTQIASVAGGVLAPVVAAFVISSLGYGKLFFMGALLLVVALIPLWLSTQTRSAIQLTMGQVLAALRAADHRHMELSFIGYAIESSIGRVIWPIFLIVVVGTVQRVGYIMTVATIMTMSGLYLVGKFTDRYSAKKLLKIGTAFYFVGWIGSIVADNPLRLFFAELYRKMSGEFILVPWSAAFFRSLNTQDYFVQLVMRDIVFNVGRIIILPFLMALFWAGVYPFTISFMVAALFTLLYPLLPEKAFISVEK